MRIINRTLSRRAAILLGSIPFALLIGAYAVASHLRRIDNPADKLLPSLGSMGDGGCDLAHGVRGRQTVGRLPAMA
ncbi:hypothetical protein [Thalassospira xiamenensis]|uniref:NitT/TauT family transport system permease protein n=1 Tax=Thalassospira xiamenensis TaxID=220697 RepID=A0A285RTA8_9PROT|nr:hypothetical protein [Thalassospira xiamenensis]SOB95517.1 NitT/TauT family transport system permease protein [Thalassospira xiamenensis]